MKSLYTLPLRVAVALLLSAPLLSTAEVLLYEQTFPWPGPAGTFPVTAVGWSSAIPNQPQRLFQLNGFDGAVHSTQSGTDIPITTAFYTTTTNGEGTFSTIDLGSLVGLTFWVDIRPNSTPANVTARFLVQLNGLDWFAASTPLPVPTIAGGFSNYSQAFTPAAAAWNTLTLSSSNAVFGGPAGADLTGQLTGAGLAFSHTVTNGTYDFDNFRITATVGALSGSVSPGGVMSLAWEGGNGIGLQSAGNLPAAWQTLSNTIGTSVATFPLNSPQGLYRLIAAPTAAGVSLARANFGFEADGAPVPTPAGWTTIGDSNSCAVVSGNAYAGAFCLQHSNSVSYQVQSRLLLTNLPNGFYRLEAFAQSSGGQSACYLSANGQLTSVPALTNWTQVVIRGIHVTNSQCVIQLVSDAAAGNWCRLDALNLIDDNIAYTFLKGGDISELTYVEQGGGEFYETNGQSMDCLQILTNHGFNIARLRLYNDPGNTNYSPSNLLPPGIQSPTNILDLASRAKAHGLQLELTFYYSDYWSNGLPHDWVGLALPQLSNAVYSFTTNFMTQMKGQGTIPEYVSLGNEIDAGLLLPFGSTGNFPQLAQLLKAGYAGVKVISPSSKVILHIGKVDAPTVEWFFNQCLANGVPWDVIGCSYYPFWTGLTSAQARTNINQFYPVFNKPVLIMETGYNWSTNACDGYPGQLGNNGPEIYPSTPQGQKNFLLKCFNDLKLVTDGHCLGDLYWDPIFICVPGEGWRLGARNVVDNTTLFDFTGHALPSLDAFQFNN